MGTVRSTVTMRGRSRATGLLVVVLTFLTVLSGAAPSAFADSYDNQVAQNKAQAAANKAAQDALAASLEDTDKALAQAAMDLQATEQRLPQAQAELAAAKDDLATAQREAAIIAGRLQDARDQEASITQTIQADTARSTAVRNALGEMARQAYRGGAEISSLGVALGAQSTDEFIATYGAVSSALRAQAQSLAGLQQVQADNRNSQARLVAVRDRITELKADADAKVVEADQARVHAEERTAEITSLIAEQTASKQTIADRLAAEKAQQAELDAQAAALAASLAEIIAKQNAARAAAGVHGPINGAVFANPTSTNPMFITSHYGWRFQPILKYYRMHAGVDLRAYCNTPIYAARAGTVQWAKWVNGYGNQVMVNHGYVNNSSLMSSYNHMNTVVVHAGESVSQGQLVGYAGMTGGVSTGCHLHFEAYVNGAVVNPEPLLGLA
ncbi:M23 family metallopeptidase [Cellulomonas sp. P24]|uniref:peptidoglycan DD-metalloendopeptidase family protein n=1 Tax=Cellulomonas sp. P24 TaxID=2885206 RepID=UPI00216ADA0C|nr:M23 family metallopeptidase [Cellulomonas sp. P24]MCR6491645.1 peptidoglycan DD-metalloendopeptidase family protein [Cellulomonas sp. P24]